MSRAQLILEPESRYASLVEMKLVIHLSEKSDKIQIKFPSSIKIMECLFTGLGSSAKSSISSEENDEVISITSLSNENQISITAKISGALDDSGYGYYPYVTSNLNISVKIMGVNQISLLVILPDGSGPYSMHTMFTINDQNYVWGSRIKHMEKPLDYYSKGEGKKIQPVIGANYVSDKNSIDAKLSIPFRIKTVNLPSLAILPLLVGIPFMVIWGLPESDVSLLTKLSSSLAAIPVFFGLWQRNTAESLDPTDFINLTWFISLIAWIAYAIFFHISGKWLTVDFTSTIWFIPYFAWIGYNLGILSWFRNNPTKPDYIPKPFIIFALTRSCFIYLQNLATSKGKDLEPEALLFRSKLKK